MDSNEKNLDNSLESAMNMTQDEIEKLLSQHENQSMSSNDDFDDADLASILSVLETEDSSDVQDISDLLNKADNNEAIDEEVLALLKKQDEQGATAYDAMDLFSGEKEKKEGFFERLIRKFKEKKAEKPEKSKKKEKTKKKTKTQMKADLQGLEQIDEQEADAVAKINKEDSMSDALALLQGGDEERLSDSQISDEPKNVDKETKKKKQKKLKKTKKKSKSGSTADEDETVKEKSKGKKEKKSKEKKQKEKQVTIEEAIESFEEEQAEMPHKKKIIMVFVASILIMLGFLVVNHFFTGHANKRLAEEAYEAEDYLECYQLLYGQKMNESQEVMFHRSELILKMDIFWEHYNDYVKERKWLEGLDELVQFVYGYPKAYEYAAEWNCVETVEGTYNQVKTILMDEYETNVQEVTAIAELESDVDYTKALVEIVEKKEKRDALKQKYPDILPEEEDRVAQDEN